MSQGRRATFFILGGYTLLVQVILLRECFLLFSGNELSIAIQLGLWLAVTALGGMIGSGFGAGVVPWLSAALPVAGVWAIAAVRLIPLCLPVRLGVEVPFPWAVLSLAVAQAPLNLLAGALFPTACRRFAPNRASSIGRFYMWEAVGATVAGCGFTFLVAGLVRGITVAIAVSAAAGLAVAILNTGSSRLLSGSTAVVFALGLLGRPAERFDEWWWRVRQPDARRILTVETPYQRIDLAQQDNQHTVFSNGLPGTTFEDTEDLTSGSRGADLFVSLHPGPRRLLVVGAGSPALIARLLDYPIEAIVYVLRDPALAKLVTPMAAAWQDPRVNLIHADGRRFLNQTDDAFDLVVFDLPPPITAAENRFFTVEAFRAVRACLAPGGVFAFALPSSAHYLAGEPALLLASVHRALEDAFGKVSVLAGPAMVFCAGGAPPDLDTLAARFARADAPIELGKGRVMRDPHEKYVVFTALYEQYFNLFRLQEQLDLMRNVDIQANSDARPLAYHLNLRRWLGEIGLTPLDEGFRVLQSLVTMVQGHSLWTFLLIGLGAVLAGLLARACAIKRAVVAGAMVTSGGAGMLGQLVIVFMYQNAFGQLYRAMGALFALYMLGLAAGSALSSGRGASTVRRAFLLLGARLLMVAVCLATLLLAKGPSNIALGVVLFLYALSLGLEYPVANRIYSEDLNGRRAAGVLHAMDHLGAAIATLLAVVLLPLAGPQGTLAALAALHAVVLASLAASLLPHLAIDS